MFRLVAPLFACLVALAAPGAYAQGSSLVTPANSRAFPVFTNVAVNSTSVTLGTFGPKDWSAFGGVAITVDRDRDACSILPQIGLYGSATYGGTYTAITDDNALVTAFSTSYYASTRSYTYVARILTPYVKIVLSGISSSGSSVCTVNAYAVGLAFSPRVSVTGPVVNGSGISPVTVGDASGNAVVVDTTLAADALYTRTSPTGLTDVYQNYGVVSVNATCSTMSVAAAANSRLSTLLVQNLSTSALCCSPYNDGAAFTKCGFVLAAGSAVNNGTGGSATLSGTNGPLWCCTSTGSADMTWMRF